MASKAAKSYPEKDARVIQYRNSSMDEFFDTTETPEELELLALQERLYNAFEHIRPGWTERLDRSSGIESTNTELLKLCRALKEAARVHTKYYLWVIQLAIRQSHPNLPRASGLCSEEVQKDIQTETGTEPAENSKYSAGNADANRSEHDDTALDAHKQTAKPSVDQVYGDTDGSKEIQSETQRREVTFRKLQRRRIAPAQEYSGGPFEPNQQAFHTSTASDSTRDRGKRHHRAETSAARISKRNRVSSKLHDWWHHRPRPCTYPVHRQSLPDKSGHTNPVPNRLYIHWYDDNEKLRQDTIAGYSRWRSRRRKIRKEERIKAKRSRKRDVKDDASQTTLLN